MSEKNLSKDYSSDSRPRYNRGLSLTGLTVTVSPHITSGETIPKVMYSVIIALIPAIIASYVFFGVKALNMIVVSVITAVVLEAGVQGLRKKPITITDGSAVITGILLAFNLSPKIPLWMVALGSAVAILVAKQTFGGLGYNIFNPALIGRAFLMAAYPSSMTSWVPTRLYTGIDASTYATPLGILQEKLHETLPGYWDLFIGNVGGCIGETSVFALIIGGLFLLYRKEITWHIPVSYILTVAILSLLLGRDPLFQILAGGLMLGAIFMATDMVTSPVTPRGMIIFGVGCGIITIFIRFFGKYPEGVSYSILVMNACTPLIDRYTVPRIFGTK